MKQLFSKAEGTVYSAMEGIYTGSNQKDDEVVLQSSERNFRTEPIQSVDQFRFGYWQLWLYTWRHFDRLGQGCPRKEDGEDTPIPAEPDPALWYWLGVLADKLGFESNQIKKLISSDPDTEIARKCLLMGRCQRYFQYDPIEFDNFQSQIASMYKSAKPISPNTRQPPLLVEGPGETLQRRCGRIFRQAHENSRDFLFLDIFYDPRNGEGREVSSLDMLHTIGRHDHPWMAPFYPWI